MADRMCSVEGCERPVDSAGWCARHYARNRRHGDPLGGIAGRDEPISQRLARYARFGAVDECWEWTGRRASNGYGRISLGGREVAVHRVSYEHFVGPIPEGLQIDHLCRNRACLNPRHLEPVSLRENVMRGIGPTAVNAAKTRCRLGHELSPANTFVRANGQRSCRICKRVRDRERYRTTERYRRMAVRRARRTA